MREASTPRLTASNVESVSELDYTVATLSVDHTRIELKAKWQPYSQWWMVLIQDVAAQNIFILDELAYERS